MLQTGHSYGTIEDSMDILRVNKKGRFLIILERFHIYANIRTNMQSKCTYRDAHKSIFETSLLFSIKQHSIAIWYSSSVQTRSLPTRENLTTAVSLQVSSSVHFRRRTLTVCSVTHVLYVPRCYFVTDCVNIQHLRPTAVL
jgi:hypothetical protein